MSQKIRTSVEIDGSLKVSQIANSTFDTDRFLVSEEGIIKYRTGAELLSDLGIATVVTSFNTRTGAITLTSGDVTGALGYTPYNASNPAGYISSYTETDPTVPAHVKSITTTEKSNWNTAFSWGNHSGLYMTQGQTRTDINSINNGGNRYDPSVNNPTNEHYAVLTYGNGGNVTGQLATHFVNGNLYSRGYNSTWSSWRRYWNDTDFTNSNISNWNTAYGWGNHASAGYLTSVTNILGNAGTVSSITGNTGLLRDRLAASAYIDAVTTSNFRTTLFGASSNGYQISTSRWNTTPSLLSGMNGYGTMMAWSGADTHGFLAIDYAGAEARVGGGNSENINWTKRLAFLDDTVPNSRTITINGVSQDLSANRSFTVTANAVETDTLATVTARGNTSTGDVNINGKIRVGSFPNSTMNSGEAWLGRAADRLAGTMTVQLGGNLDRKFEVVDYGWTTVNFFVNGYGVAEASGSMRAPIFYDSNNSGYYGDFASSGTSLSINGGIVTTAPTGSILLHHQVSEANAWLFRENAPNWGLFWFNTGTQSGQVIGSYTTIGAELFGTNNGVGGFNPNSAWSGTNSDTRASWMLSNYTGYIWSNSTMFAAGDMRSPIYYDANDTSYYADFNSTSDSAIRTRGGMLMGPNPTWGAYLQVGGNGNNTNYATVVTTDGNLHLDGAVGSSMYLNYYHNGAIYLNGSTYSISSNGAYYNGTSAAANSVAWGNVSSKPSYIMYYQGFTLNADTMDSNATGFTYAVNAPYVGPIAKFSTGGGYDLQINANYGGGGAIAYRTRNGDIGSNNPWYRLYSDAYRPYADNSGTVGGYSVAVGGSANTIPTRNASGYLIPENWIQLNGAYGLYSPNNNAHLRPNNLTYGPWLVTGSRNGWGGIEFESGNGNPTLMISGDSNTVGFHNNSYGWQIRWANGLLYSGRNSYGGNDSAVLQEDKWIGSKYFGSDGAIYGTVFYDANDGGRFVDLSSTGDSIRASGDIVAFYSDERLKDRHGNIQNALDKVLSLNGFHYTPNDRAQELGYKYKEEIGVSAQEVEAVLPQLIKDAPIGHGYKTLDYGKLTPLLIEAIKEQQTQIEELKELVNKLINK